MNMAVKYGPGLKSFIDPSIYIQNIYYIYLNRFHQDIGVEPDFWVFSKATTRWGKDDLFASNQSRLVDLDLLRFPTDDS